MRCFPFLDQLKDNKKRIFMRRLFHFLLTASLALPMPGCSLNKDKSKDTKPVIETLVSARESWNGDLYSYPKGQALMTLLKITAPVGFRTPVHTHPQPGVAYVFKGKLDCIVTAEKTKVFSAGDSFATTFGDTPHYCESIGNESAIVFVTYAGVEQKPVTIPLKK
tara:strand:- start:1375 stop:1869 length:495 start_codon:yes stop_codon:yes gene_type:complete